MLCQRQKQTYRMKRELVITEPRGGEFFRCGKVPFNNIREVWILGPPYSEDCKSFPINTLLHYTQVPFKKGLTVIRKICIWLFLYK